MSKGERERLNLKEEKSLIYGEVDFQSFARILRKIQSILPLSIRTVNSRGDAATTHNNESSSNKRGGGVFYDLGSGTGKGVFAARLTQDFDKCVGIEILESKFSKQAPPGTCIGR